MADDIVTALPPPPQPHHTPDPDPAPSPEPAPIPVPPYQAECCARGHNFQARYNDIPPDAPAFDSAAEACNDYWDKDEVIEVIESLTKRIYVCDVCIRCGLTAGVVRDI